MEKSQGPEKLASGVDHEEGSGVLFAMSCGTLSRGQNQTMMLDAEMSVAYTPPPLLLKADPKVAVSPVVIAQPVLSPLLTWQVDVDSVPDISLDAISQVAPVCSVTWFVCASLTCSTMSVVALAHARRNFSCPSRAIPISPPFGQSGPSVQKAGHVPHIPPGMCARSRMIKPVWYASLLLMRMLGLPFGVDCCVETRICALVEELLIRLSSRPLYSTKPSVGSAPAKKSKESKKSDWK